MKFQISKSNFFPEISHIFVRPKIFLFTKLKTLAAACLLWAVRWGVTTVANIPIKFSSLDDDSDNECEEAQLAAP